MAVLPERFRDIQTGLVIARNGESKFLLPFGGTPSLDSILFALQTIENID